MRILIINADYPNFLRTLYTRIAGLASQPYAIQMVARNDSLFGVADFYSRNFCSLGHEAIEVHVNNHWLQYAWSHEHGMNVVPPLAPSARASRAASVKAFLRRVYAYGGKLVGRETSQISAWELAILAAQIEEFKPDIILNQDTYYVRSRCLGPIKGKATLVGQNAAALPSGELYEPYDLLISSLPQYVDYFRQAGKRAELNRLAFEPSVLTKLGPAPVRDIQLSFVGSLSPEHVSRIDFLEGIARRAPLLVWGNGIEKLPATSPLHKCYKGEVWGRDMYNVLRRSEITLNKHINLAGRMANNMRLYEATGAGALLLTDNQANLHEIFRPGREAETYDAATDCLVKIETLLKDAEHREDIAAAGQKAAIETHNYHNRCRELVALFERFA